MIVSLLNIERHRLIAFDLFKINNISKIFVTIIITNLFSNNLLIFYLNRGRYVKN